MNTNESQKNIMEIAASKIKHNHSSVKSVVAVALALWLGLVLLIGTRGGFDPPPGSPPLPIFFGFAVPLAVFFAAYTGWRAFREFVLGIDLRLTAAIQAWRLAGFGFLSLYAYGILPGLFAFPAGLGDMAIGVTAPGIVLGLIDRAGFLTSRRYVIWNIMGIVDLVVAVSLGTLCSGFFPGIIGTVTTSPMSRLPLVLIPGYLVPIFIMLHVTALFQAWQLARAGKFEKPPHTATLRLA